VESMAGKYTESTVVCGAVVLEDPGICDPISDPKTSILGQSVRTIISHIRPHKCSDMHILPSSVRIVDQTSDCIQAIFYRQLGPNWMAHLWLLVSLNCGSETSNLPSIRPQFGLDISTYGSHMYVGWIGLVSKFLRFRTH
jgi:hypothetical protein